MKKTYQTPTMAVELFALTQSIASCDIKIGLLNSECVKSDDSASDEMKDLAWSDYFIDDGCKVSAEGMDGDNGICYHTNANTAFNS